jgi:hypothetical protein
MLRSQPLKLPRRDAPLRRGFGLGQIGAKASNRMACGHGLHSGCACTKSGPSWEMLQQRLNQRYAGSFRGCLLAPEIGGIIGRDPKEPFYKSL